MKSIAKNSEEIYSIICKKKQILFSELAQQSMLGDTNLCLSISWLIQHNKIKQNSRGGTVYYTLA
ncbi:MAG: hypothetical protein ACOYJE_06675 [Bacteroidaceae bacterium]